MTASQSEATGEHFGLKRSAPSIRRADAPLTPATSHEKFWKRYEILPRSCLRWKSRLTMYRVLTLADLALVCALGFAAYKAFELGPYEAAHLFGRCVHVFVVAVQGYI